MIILACGISLNTKTDLGVSPLISMPFAVSQIWHLNFAFLAFLMYTAFTILEIFLEGDFSCRFPWHSVCCCSSSTQASMFSCKVWG